MLKYQVPKRGGKKYFLKFEKQINKFTYSILCTPLVNNNSIKTIIFLQFYNPFEADDIFTVTGLQPNTWILLASGVKFVTNPRYSMKTEAGKKSKLQAQWATDIYTETFT